MTDTSEITAERPVGARLPRYSLIAGGVLLALVAGLAIVLLAGGSGSHGDGSRAAAAPPGAKTAAKAAAARPRAGSAPANTRPAATVAPSHTTGVGVGGKRVNVAEVADPQEAASFPAPATVHHKAAATPSRAGEQVVAAGAPSDAEVKRELQQMQAVERTAKEAQTQRLTPVAGGNSVGGNGTIPIPSSVPEVVQRVIAGANEIADFPYVFGGGHASFVDNAYDCSGSVSYALAAGGLLSAPETSGELESWGAPGPGRYITVYAAAGHTYMYVDGVLYDTAGRSGVYASRWQVSPTNNAGYVARHWPGL